MTIDKSTIEISLRHKILGRLLIGEVGGDFSIKLEDQVLITETGYENLTSYPFDPALMGR